MAARVVNVREVNRAGRFPREIFTGVNVSPRARESARDESRLIFTTDLGTLSLYMMKFRARMISLRNLIRPIYQSGILFQKYFLSAPKILESREN